MRFFEKDILRKIDSNNPLFPDELREITVYIKKSWKKPNTEMYRGIIKLLGRFFLIEYKNTDGLKTDISQPLEIIPTSPTDVFVYVKKQQEFVSKDGKLSIPLEETNAFYGRILLCSDIEFENFMKCLKTRILEE